KKGLAQSSAIMVNYLYELNAIESNNEKFLKKIVVYSKNLDKLF
ncbi:MAG: decarboxylase, partial [Betaproteobacteria bacterium]|nr:decarboxylase [Betaproteobacteria bacterium]